MTPRKKVLLILFLAIGLSLPPVAHAYYEQEMPVLRNTAGGALTGALVANASGGDGGEGALWGMGVGALRGAAQRRQQVEQQRTRELELQQAYQQGQQQARMDYRQPQNYQYANNMAYGGQPQPYQQPYQQAYRPPAQGQRYGQPQQQRYPSY